jgi:hypothetical protein
MFQVFDIMIRCSGCGRSLETGYQTTSREALERDFLSEFSAFCSSCRLNQSAKKNEALLRIRDNRSADSSLWRPNR